VDGADDAKPTWRHAAIALLIQSVAMAGFWSIRVYFGADAYRPLQLVLLLVGIVALVVMIALGTLALRRTRHTT